MVAGEASGDLLAGLLLDGLKQRWPAIQVYGIGGPQMAARGFDAWWPHGRLAVRGYVEVLRHYWAIAAIRNALSARLLADPPDLFIGVDAPDFNLGLEARLRRAGVKTIQFVCPSIWAWRANRVTRIAASVDHVLCLFPFEPALLHAHGIAATYVGHPLADAIPIVPPRAQARAALALPADAGVVALLPGSRASEIDTIAPRFLQAAALMHAQRPDLLFVLPVVAGLRAQLERVLARHGGGTPIVLVDGRSHDVLAACDVTLIASGTATLEAMLFKRPMVIAYAMNALSWQMMRRMKVQPWVGLPNILAQSFVVPELLQNAATPAALAREVLAWLDAPERAAGVHDRFTELHHLLRCDTQRAATDAIAAILATA